MMRRALDCVGVANRVRHSVKLLEQIPFLQACLVRALLPPAHVNRLARMTTEYAARQTWQVQQCE